MSQSVKAPVTRIYIVQNDTGSNLVNNQILFNSTDLLDQNQFANLFCIFYKFFAKAYGEAWENKVGYSPQKKKTK